MFRMFSGYVLIDYVIKIFTRGGELKSRLNYITKEVKHKRIFGSDILFFLIRIFFITILRLGEILGIC